MKRLKILIGCEESQQVCKAFRALGHIAYSCDLLPCSGGRPEWHLQMNIFRAIRLKKWDAGIFFPPCTYLTIAATWLLKDQPRRKSGVLVGKQRREAQRKAIGFFMRLWNCRIKRIAIENPVGIMSTVFRKPDQIIHPWMFGHGETKPTCLWLKNLPQLQPTRIVQGREHRILMLSPGKERGRLRGLTFPGIAKAMAKQWSKHMQGIPQPAILNGIQEVMVMRTWAKYLLNELKRL